MSQPTKTSQDAASAAPKTRAGFAAIVGRPNVGKSTLLNALLGEKLAIVSDRPQTTRNRVLGVLTDGSDQVIFVDTPGIHRSRANLNRFMVQEALAALDGVDCVILVTEAIKGSSGIDPLDRYVLEQIQQHRYQREGQGHDDLIVVLNKIDRVGERSGLLPLIQTWSEAGISRVVPTAAIRKDGIDRLMIEVRDRMPEGPHLYPEDMLTDRAERFLAAELIREQVFTNCRQELPYSTAVEITQFEERRSKGDVAIEAEIHVEREGQKAIVIGKKGAMIGQIGTAARQAISALMRCEVHLRLQVHVQSDWTRSPQARRRFGYE